MIPGRKWMAAGLVGAVGLPIAFSSKSGVSTWLAPKAAESAGTAAESDEPAAPGSQQEVRAREVKQATTGRIDTPSIPEAFRFDMTPGWVLARWERVSTSLADLDLQGYRVALVTGGRETDLAGSLTYYFNHKQRVQKIAFQGATGNPAELIGWLTRQYGFRRVVGGPPRVHIYRMRKFSQIASELRVAPSNVVSANSPNARYEISLEMTRAD